MKQWRSIWSTKKKESFSGEAKPGLLNFFHLTIIGLGSSLAFGISVLTGHLLRNVAGPAAVISISLAGFTALVGGLCFAEFGVRFLKVDSVYGYCYLWSKEYAAFVFGWILILEYVAGTASAAKGVIAFTDSLSEYEMSDFLKRIASLSPHDAFPYFDFLSLGIVVVITVLMSFGMKESAAVKKLFTMCNIILLITIISAGAFKVELNNWHPEGTPDGKFEGGFTPFGVLGVAKGAAIAFYGFIGFDAVSSTGSDVEKRKRNLPLAIVATTLFTLGVHAGVGVILTLMLPFHKHEPHAVVPFAFQQVGWVTLKWIVAVATFFGFTNSFFGVIYPLPRILYAMANDGLLFHCLGNRQSRLRIPVAASVTGGLVAATTAALISFENLVNLTVLAALLILTILAVNVILLRYSPKFEGEERLSESWPRLINPHSDISMKAVMQNYFNFTAKNPTNLTKKIILANMVLFCLSSIGVGVVFNVYNRALMENAVGTVILVGFFLFILLLNVISIMCQPKSQESAPFKVPLVPFLPCLSIFLNIFLMLTFESLTWIFFSSWMVAGIMPYSVWRFLKCFRKEVGENSLYEINKSNTVKLCESIWKMKSEKKSFYEGAVNPVFSDETDEPNKVDTDNDGDTNKHNLLKQIDIIQKAESMKENAKPSGNELELNFVYAENTEIGSDLPEDDKVHWECVAEIHTEDEFLQESNVLEIVDNTYHFLSELSRDDAPRSFDKSKDRSEHLVVSNTNSLHEVDSLENTVFESGGTLEKSAQLNSPQPVPEHPTGNGHLLIKEELLNKVKQVMESRRNERNEVLDESENAKEISVKVNEEELIKEKSSSDKSSAKSTSPDLYNYGEKDQKEEKVKSTFYTPPEGEVIAKVNDVLNGTVEVQGAASVPEEQNEIKEFKEKLNQLLKNQISGSAIPTKNLPMTKPSVGTESDTATDLRDKDGKDILRDSVKTLNKSQIRGKLELLLAKGPPKRPSLGSSFNIKVKETDKEAEHEKSDGELLNGQKIQIINNENGKKSEKYSPDPPNKTESIISLENNKLQNDVCCSE